MDGFLIFLSLVVYLLLTFFRPVWGTYLILLLLPTYQIRFQFFGLPTTFLEWMILLHALVTAVWLLKKNIKLPLKKIVLPLRWFIILAGAFATAAFLSVFVAPNTVKALGIFRAYILEALIFCVLLLVWINTKERLYRCFLCLGALVGYLAIFGFFQYLTLFALPPSWWGPGAEPRRVVSLFSYPNAVSLLIGPVLAALTALLVIKPQDHLVERHKKIIIFVLSLGIGLLVLTFSRGGWLGYTAATAFLLPFTKLKKTLLVLMAAAVVGSLMIPTFQERVLPALRGEDPAGQERLKLWAGAWEIIKIQPVLGTGLTGFREWYGALRTTNQDEILNYPHNFFLNFWVETGLLGLLAILGVFLWNFKTAAGMFTTRVSSRPLILAALAGLVNIFVHGLVDAPFFKNDLALSFWFFLSIIPAALLAENIKPNEENKKLPT
ncbi:MAG: O-antigen ligase family protein [Candidatus Doudnabacteria bacterium]|nr:O-antigen ligase family protein [Candidatus Doudnabacteria bacterium]